MRSLALLTLCVSSLFASTADARLFWQTYGSTIATVDGGCTWNWNQDYFVPRYPSSGRYGLFSPCKTSCTTSPACKWCHPFYPGYCSIYGPCHYCWRNHVYRAYCGCKPLRLGSGPWRHGCGPGCQSIPLRPYGACGAGDTSSQACLMAEGFALELVAPLPNVEPPEFVVLGSISVEGDGLLANMDLTPVGSPADGRVFIGPQTVVPSQNLPSLGIPQSINPTQSIPSP